jgi:hypothetical protein
MFWAGGRERVKTEINDNFGKTNVKTRGDCVGMQ